MIYFVLIMFLALAWMLLNGSYSSANFAIGFVVGFVALRLCQPFGLRTSYFCRFGAFVSLIGYFIYEMTSSAARVVWDVITPTHLSEPDIVYVPLDVETEVEITLLANMISLTPGSLSLDVTADKKQLIVHAMFARDHQMVVRQIKTGLERRILEVTRG